MFCPVILISKPCHVLHMVRNRTPWKIKIWHNDIIFYQRLINSKFNLHRILRALHFLFLPITFTVIILSCNWKKQTEKRDRRLLVCLNWTWLRACSCSVTFISSSIYQFSIYIFPSYIEKKNHLNVFHEGSLHVPH